MTISFVLIITEPSYNDYRIYKKLKKISEVKEVDAVLGGYDFICKVDNNNDLIISKIEEIPGVYFAKILKGVEY